MIHTIQLKILFTSISLLYLFHPVWAENNQFSSEYSNNQIEWNTKHSMMVSNQISQANELMTLASDSEKTETVSEKKVGQKIPVFSQEGELIAIKTLDRNGNIIEVEFINKIENIDRSTGASSKKNENEDLIFLENQSSSNEFIETFELEI